MSSTSSEEERLPVRVVLKLSGEALMGDSVGSINSEAIKAVATEIAPVVAAGVQLGIVVGGGNFFRGARPHDQGFSRVTGDHLGMLATVLNALAIQDVFRSAGVVTQVMSALAVDGIVERYYYRRAIEYLERGEVVVFAAGTGNPFVTTDTALCLRGIELGATMVLKGTNVDGVYSQDPKQNLAAQLYSHLTYEEVLQQRLQVMDLAAFCLGQSHNLKLGVFNLSKPGALSRMLRGLPEGTIIS